MKWRFAVPLVLGAALVCVPGAFDSPVGGPPLGAAGRVALCGLAAMAALFCFFPVRGRPGRWLAPALAACIALKLVLSFYSAPSGWFSEYRFFDTKGAVHAAALHWRFASHPFRIDPAILVDASHSDLHFLNQAQLFGNPPYSRIRREIEFPLNVSWRGAVTVGRRGQFTLTGTADGRLRVAVRHPGSPSDAFEIVGTGRRTVELDEGVHWIHVVYDKPAGVAPLAAFSVLDASTGRPPLVRPWLSTRPDWDARLTSGVVFGGLALLAAAIVWIYVREEKTAWTGGVARTAGVVITCAVLALTAATVVRSLGHTAFLHGGGDPLTYGSDARSILLGDTLLLRGWPLGQARPFFHYPLYPYVLAGAHAVAGDDLSTILLLNGLALSLLPWLFWQLGWARLRWPAAIAANLALLVFIRRYCWPIASYLQPSFPDMLFMPIVFGTLVMLRRSFEEPRPWHLIATGILMGLGAAARPSFLTMVLLAPFGLLVAMWPRRGIPWIAASGWLAAGVLAALLPFTMRNVVAAGQFVVLVNSWVQIPYFLIPPEVTDRPVGAMTLGHALGMARDIVAKDPLGALWVEARKLIFSLGYMSAGPRGASTSNSLTLFTAAFALAVWLRRLRSPVITVLGLFVVSHLCAMILAAPWTFGMKAILPLHGAFLFGAAYLLDPRAASEAPAPGSRLASSTPDRQG